MWIMIAGPYRTGGGAADPMIRAANLKVLNEAAVALHRAGCGRDACVRCMAGVR